MRLAKYAWISVLTVASCHPEQDTEPKTLDFGRFTIVVPGSWQPVIKTGYDSYVGGIRAGGLGEIEFDYGRFASNLDVDPDTHETFWTTIDGRKAKLVKPRRGSKGITGVYFESVDESGTLKFQMSSRDARPAVREQLISAFESITFRSIDEIPPFVPDCIRDLIESIRSEPVRNPPASVWQFEYGGAVVYYVPSYCCDIPSMLYDESCKFICSPDGGFTGSGDGNCTSDLERGLLVWQDLR
ncbi:MAG: hypothetical protein LOY03_17010 [Cyclobacteriaceae bacterium]|jgi:uncharacterized protein YbaR (Trm112 family)|nr:hypothetical protein [Cyclobacteriaceae bacterium]